MDPGTAFPGYTKGGAWNGWTCPYFGKNVAKQVAEHHRDLHRHDREEGYRADYDAKEDVFVFHDPQYGQPRKFGSVEAKDEKTCPIGVYCWMWVEK